MKRAHLLSTRVEDIPADFWSSGACEVLILSRWAQDRPAEARWIQDNLPDLPHLVWVASSGTLAQAGQSKWIALSKEAILASAAAVNQHLQISRTESWGLTLPLAHVGGLGILARAHLLGQTISTPMSEKWDVERMRTWQGELLSLVPTQVFDLVARRIPAPENLRAVIVGGDRITPTLLQQGRSLGWPLFPSYGLTECASQVATTLPGDDFGATLLPHVQARTDEEGRLWLASPSLFTGTATIDNERMTYQERTEAFWGTEDVAEISGKQLRILGRRDSFVKVRGEKVDLVNLEIELQQRLPSLVIISKPDARDGTALWGFAESSLPLEELNQGLLPHQKLRGLHVIPSLPRNSLGKVKRGELREMLS